MNTQTMIPISDRLPTASDADAWGRVLAISPHVNEPFLIGWQSVHVTFHEITHWRKP